MSKRISFEKISVERSSINPKKQDFSEIVVYPTLNVIEPDNKDLKFDLGRDEDSEKQSVSSAEIVKNELTVPVVPQKLNTLKIANIKIKGLDENIRSNLKLRK